MLVIVASLLVAACPQGGRAMAEVGQPAVQAAPAAALRACAASREPFWLSFLAAPAAPGAPAGLPVEAKWERDGAKWPNATVTRNGSGITGYAIVGSYSGRAHVCAWRPCRAVWDDAKYGIWGPPRHFLLVDAPEVPVGQEGIPPQAGNEPGAPVEPEGTLPRIGHALEPEGAVLQVGHMPEGLVEPRGAALNVLVEHTGHAPEAPVEPEGAALQFGNVPQDAVQPEGNALEAPVPRLEADSASDEKAAADSDASDFDIADFDMRHLWGSDTAAGFDAPPLFL